MSSKHWMIVAAVGALWLWHKKRGISTPATVGTDNVVTATASEPSNFMSAWGLSK